MADTVAIVGMAFRLPGARDEGALLDLLTHRRTAIVPVPSDRWDGPALHDPRHGTPNRTVMARGGFLDRIDLFDAGFFGISAREARAMDPQQRMVLEEAWRCLENAGLRREDLRGTAVGVFAGIMASDYQQNASAPGQDVDGFSALGTYGALLANRVSNAFQWTGPSFTVDAACASSLVALHAARRSLLAGECDLAMVVAANALIHPWRSISFSQARMLSPDGLCRTFDAGANGYVQGEGVLAVLLARSGEVPARGLRERARLLGSAVNHVGPSRSVTAPSTASQEAVIQAALQAAGLGADAISYVEAHGTGTPLGDPIEVAALASVLGPREPDAVCGIGSIKSNIGHLEAAAGLAGLVKLVLMLERRVLLPTAGIETVNPLIDMDRGPVKPVVEPRPWAADPPVAGLSSFGFGGANGHAILGAAPAAARRPAAPRSDRVQPLLVSAASEAGLRRSLDALAAWLPRAEAEGISPADLCQTLMLRRAALPFRFAATVAGWPDLAAAVSSGLAKPARDGPWMLRIGQADSLSEARWNAMTRELPALAERAARAEEEARAAGIRRSSRLVALARLHALAGLVLDAGLAPDVVYGEGLGRWAVMTATGVLDLADAVLATGEGRQPAPRLRRPSHPVYDPVGERVLPPRVIDAEYLRALRDGCIANWLPDRDLSELRRRSELLHGGNHTYRGFLEPWTALGIDPASTARPAEVLAMAVARRRTCERWRIPEAGTVLPAELDELAHLVASGGLAPEQAVALLTDGDPAGVAAEVDLAALDPAFVGRTMPILAARWSALSEIADVDAWLHGRAGRYRKPPPMGVDRTVDIGGVSVAGEGDRVGLPLDPGFGSALMAVLGERWATGRKVDWSCFARPHRIVDAPAYPFEPERHWLSMPASRDAGVAAAVDPAPMYRIGWAPLPLSPGDRPVPRPVLHVTGRSDAARAFAAALAGACPDAATVDAGAQVALDGFATIVVSTPFDHVGSAAEALTEALLMPLVRLAVRAAANESPCRLVVAGPAADPAFAAAVAVARSVAAENRVTLQAYGLAVSREIPAVAMRTALALLEPPEAGLLRVGREGLEQRHLVRTPRATGGAGTGGARTDGAGTNGVWLLVGGFGGIGEALVAHLARSGVRAVGVIGRRAPEAVEAVRERLRGRGIAVAYAAGDVTDEASLERAADAIERETGPVTTVVHAEMVLADAAAAAMSEETFAAAFLPKALGFTAVDRVFRQRRGTAAMPRRVVFGSILGLTGNAGQANYAAASAYQQALAERAAAEGTEVRHIAWGYWSEVGRVANARHRSRVARIGLLPMQTAAGMAALHAALRGSEVSTVAAVLAETREHALLAELGSAGDADPAVAGLRELDRLAVLRIRAAFAAAGWLPGVFDEAAAARLGVAEGQERLFTALRGFLDARGWRMPDSGTAAEADALAGWLRASQPGLGGVVALLEAATADTVAVLTGAKAGTQVIFPSGDLGLVEGYYHGNPQADAANRRTAERVAEVVRAKVAVSGRRGPVRVLEVGAGTGGTTQAVLTALDAVADGRNDLVEYVFSDLSVAFLRRARRFEAGRPWFSTRAFDFDADPDGFDALGRFDVVLAANAVHVTADIRSMLRRLGCRMAPEAVLVLNEIMRLGEHHTAIFGLLPGWWLATDDRAGAGPLLTPRQWEAALDGLFRINGLDGPSDAEGPVQGVLVAEWTGDAVAGPSTSAAVEAPAGAAAAPDVGGTGDRILALVAEVLGIDPARLDPDARFDELGLDSILSLDLADKLAAETGVALDPATIAGLATPAALKARVAANDRPSPVTRATAVPAAAAQPAVPQLTDPEAAIAIVGMAGCFPGADSLSALRRLIRSGAAAFGPVPDGRWSEADLASAGEVRAVRGAFLASAWDFDAARFGVSGREAILIDPQQRLLLEQTLAALADAGRPDRRLPDDTAVGVFVGCSEGDYARKLATAGHPVEAQSLAALLPSSCAARIAHAFGFEGPAMTVDLACASGLAALHLAAGALRRGECSLAVVGAASVQSGPAFVQRVAKAGLLSARGVPRPFQPDGDGIVLGEGAVVLVLKPLAAARADGDRVHAVLRGTALRQAGRGDGLTAPSPAAQLRAMRNALHDAALTAADLVAIEAHGVGTMAGDGAEAEALASLFPDRAPVIAVDTVKPVLGHGLAVSGLSAVAVTALGFRSEGGLARLPAGVAFPGCSLVPAARAGHRVGPTLVNGFSLNGACAAAVLEPDGDGAPAPRREAPVTRSVTLSAALRAELDDRLEALGEWVAREAVEPSDVAAVLSGDEPRRHRVAVDPRDPGRALNAAPGAPVERPAAPSQPVGYPFARRRYWPGTSAPVQPAERSDPLVVVAEALGLEPRRLQPDDVLVELGMDSILAIEIRARLARIGCAVGVRDLLGGRPIGAVLADAGAVEAVAPIEPDAASRHEPFALTELQLAYLIGRSRSVALGGTGCHVYWEFVAADRALDPGRLERTWNRLIEAHGMLRAVFTDDGLQHIQPEVPFYRIAMHDWRGADPAEPLAALRERMAHEVFEPARWPLFRVEASRDDSGTRLHLSIDLLIIDVLSLFGLLRDWGRLYDDPAAAATAPALSFRDYVIAFERLRAGPARDRALEFWQRAIAETPPAPALPRARSDADLRAARFSRRRTEVAAEGWTRLQERARARGATPNALLLTLLGATLAHWSEAPDFSLNLTVHDRRPVHPDVDRVIGDFTSTILVPLGADRDGGFARRLRMVSEAVAERLDHALVSGIEAARRFGTPATRGALAWVFTSMLGYGAVLGRDRRITSLGRLDWGVTQTPQVLLDVQAFEEDGRLVVTWDSVDAAFPDGLLELAFDAFAAGLVALAAPEVDLAGSLTAAIAEREQEARTEINRTDGPLPDDLLHEPLMRRALAEPNRVAVVAPEATWTLGDLAGRALAVAALLPDLLPDTLVGVAFEKSAWQLAAAFGVVIAGGAYLPLDPGLPPDRSRRLALLGEVGIVLTSEALAGRLAVPEGVRVVVVDRLAPAPLPDRLPERRAGPDDLAYVLFTSGSTGEPKGVMIEHRAALNTVLDCNDRFAVGPDDRIFGLSSLGFDLSVYDVFGVPAAGGAVVLPAAATLRDAEALAAQVGAAGVTIWNSVPMVLDMVLQSGPPPGSLDTLRLAMLSGDWIPLDLPGALARQVPRAVLYSLGGATEAAIWSICHRVDGLRPGWRSVPYGRPMRNQRFHVLDDDLEPCADGVEGDLYIAGAGLARGYWRDPVKTAAAFMLHPRIGERMYRTGDRGRWRAGGLIEFLGRCDGQVKIGGFRIELGEVEAAAVALPAVRLAVAVTEGDDGPGGRKRLVLHVVPADGRIDADALRAELARTLPDYMVPRVIRAQAALPLTANGKVDRKAVSDDAAGPSPESDGADTGQQVRVGRSRDQLAGGIAAIVAEVIGLETVAPHTSFFDLGADSLAAVVVNRRLRSELGLTTRVTDLFEHPTVSRLADHLAQANGTDVVAVVGTGPVEPSYDHNDRVDDAVPIRRRAMLRQAFRERFRLPERA